MQMKHALHVPHISNRTFAIAVLAAVVMFGFMFGVPLVREVVRAVCDFFARCAP